MASPLGLSRKLGHQHLELPSPGPQDVDSCGPCPLAFLFPHLHSGATSCSAGWAKAVLQESGMWAESLGT